MGESVSRHFLLIYNEGNGNKLDLVNVASMERGALEGGTMEALDTL